MPISRRMASAPDPGRKATTWLISPPAFIWGHVLSSLCTRVRASGRPDSFARPRPLKGHSPNRSTAVIADWTVHEHTSYPLSSKGSGEACNVGDDHDDGRR